MDDFLSKYVGKFSIIILGKLRVLIIFKNFSKEKMGNTESRKMYQDVKCDCVNIQMGNL